MAGEPHRHLAALRFPIDLRRAAGSFILATPTDDDPANGTRRVVPGSGGRSGPVAQVAAGARGLGVRGLGRHAGHAGPFSIKPLAGDVPAGASPGTSLPLRRDLSSLPEAIALF